MPTENLAALARKTARDVKKLAAKLMVCKARRFILLFVLLCSVASLAKDRAWKDAVFLGIGSSNSGAAAVPVGTSVVAFPLIARTYWFKCEGLTYALATPHLSTRRGPTLTVNGQAKFAVDGHIAHVLDEEGKDWKFNIVEKIANKE
jgi:hypothetical protein